MTTPHISKSTIYLNIEYLSQFLKPSFILNKKIHEAEKDWKPMGLRTLDQSLQIGVLEQFIIERFEIPFFCKVGEISVIVNSDILLGKSILGQRIQKLCSSKPEYMDSEMGSLEAVYTANLRHTLGYAYVTQCEDNCNWRTSFAIMNCLFSTVCRNDQTQEKVKLQDEEKSEITNLEESNFHKYCLQVITHYNLNLV